MARTRLPALSEEEAAAVAQGADFWVYVKPVALYRALAERSANSPCILRRNLAYTKLPSGPQHRDGAREGGGCGSIELGFLGYEYRAALGGRERGITVCVSLCEEVITTGDWLYRPLRSWVVRLGPGEQPSVAMPPPPASRLASRAAPCSRVALLVVWDDHPDMGGLRRRRPVAPVCTDIRRGGSWLAFGIVPHGAVVWGATVPVFKAAGTMQVRMAPFTLDMYASELGTHVGFVKCAEARARGRLCSCTVSVSHPRPAAIDRSREGGGRDRAVAVAEPVHFLYLYGDNQRYQHEVVEGCRCPLCGAACGCFLGMRVHLETWHDLFKFTASTAEGLNVIRVECPPGLHSPNGGLVSAEASRLRGRGEKTFSYYMPARGRTFKGRLGCFYQARRRQLMRRRAQAQPASTQAPQGLPPSGIGAGRRGAERGAEERAEEPGLPSHPWHAARQQEFQDKRSQRVITTGQREVPRAPDSRVGGWKAQGGEGQLGKGAQREPEANDADAFSAGQQQQHGPAPLPQSSAPQCTNYSPKENWAESHPFYQCRTAMPMPLETLLEGPETEDEEDHEMQRLQVYRDIHQPRDMSPDERAFFKMWNIFVLGQPIRSDAYTPYACIEFAQQHADTLSSSPELRTYLSLFLLNLYEYDLVTADVMDRCLAIASGCKVPCTPANGCQAPVHGAADQQCSQESLEPGSDGCEEQQGQGAVAEGARAS
eukprot:evm.model.scf_60.13 EVM.evm.TU.scf_60.13   scf_60:110956-113091(+)